MITHTETYARLYAQARRTGRCNGCGRTTRRQRTFEMTVSPFNKNPDGTVRTPAEVQAAVQAKADQWTPDQAVFDHAACPPRAGGR